MPLICYILILKYKLRALWEQGTDYLSEGYDAARALNLGWIKLEKMNSILGLAAVCGSESILQVKVSNSANSFFP